MFTVYDRRQDRATSIDHGARSWYNLVYSNIANRGYRTHFD
jgi:hypothetical protein